MVVVVMFILKNGMKINMKDKVKIDINMDYKKTFSLNEFKKTITRVENIAIIVLLFSLFLPYYEYVVYSRTGINFLTNFPIMYIVPILSLVIIGLRPTCKKEQVLKIIKLALGTFILLTFLFFVLFHDYDMKFGFYIFGILGVLIILGTLEKLQLSNAQPSININKKV